MTRERQATYWIVGLVVFVVLLYALRDVLLPFVLGIAVAYFLDPAADRLEKWGLPRWLAATALTVAFLVAVVLFLALLFPLLQAQLLQLAVKMPGYVEMLRHRLEDALSLLQTKLAPGEVEKIKDAIGGVAGDLGKWLVGLVSGLWSGGLAVFNLLSLVVITPIVAFYLLRDWDLLIAKIDSWLPRHSADTIREQVAKIDATLAGFARGQALVCIILGSFYGIALTLAGLNFGLIIGLIAGLISFIPFVGALVGLVVSVGLAVAQFWPDWPPILIVAAIFAVGQVLEGNVISPKLVGDRVGLHPVWMIFALLAGGALFGFLGILLAVPTVATIGVLTRFALSRYLASPLYGLPPPSGPDSDGTA